MALVLDAIAASGETAGGGPRSSGHARPGFLLGRYSLDDHARTTAAASGRLAVVRGELVWDRQGAPPP